ncbi:autotransporter domain-containing protein [Hyphomicrobium sp. 2TAF46]|uniref:autotransporter domain-containing protein n=1 Tax=Hyphomicrobium sp. 2TAF46 TaxID=3233019 RepID=UPI003F9150CB
MYRNDERAGARRNTARLTRFALLATTALCSLASFSRASLAQAVIDGGASETVPGTQASPWNVGGKLTVGDAQTGSLLIGPNGAVISDSAMIGNSFGSSGDVKLTGSDFLNPAIWHAGSTLVVGSDGVGKLTLSNGELQSVQASLGSGTTGVGTVIVSDSSEWTNSGGLIIGEYGVGSVRIEAGSNLQSAGMDIGLESGSLGRLTITGDHSSWMDTNYTIVGGRGSGELIVTDGAVAISSGLSIVGSEASGTAFVSGAGSVWHTTDLYVGAYNGGFGILTIDQGAALTSAGDAYLGLNQGASGFVNVMGPGSNWTVTNALTVGVDGGASVSIEDGGTVYAGIVMVGNGSGIGSVLVSGENSTLTSDFGLGVGIGLVGQGLGSLQIENGGRVLVSTSDAFIGYNLGSEGMVMVTGKDSLLNVVAGDLYIGGVGSSAAHGELTVQNGGVVRVNGGSGTIHVAEANVADSVGVINIGGNIPIDPPPGVLLPEDPGTIDAAAIDLGSWGALNFFHTSANYAFAPVIEGSGSVNVISGTTILTADSSSFTGTTTVFGGILSVNGKLGGMVDVWLPGRLQGTGTVGDTVVSGTLAPGNSIGTLNVAGNITFNVGSIYEVEVNAAGQSDKIVAIGAATINGGSVNVLAGMGNYAPATTYTILTANGGRTGTFTEGVNSNLAFLDPSLSYDTGNVYLTMTRNAVGFSNVGITPNQIASGGGVESLGSGNSVYDGVLNLSAPQAQYAFDQLSGEIHASAKTAMIEDSRFLRNAVYDRMRAAFDSAGAAKGGVATYADGKPVAVAATTDRLAAWGQGFGAWGDTDGDGNAARLNRTIGGVFLGADAPVFDSWRFGAVAGYSRTSFDVKDRHSSGSSDNYHLGVYGGTHWGSLAFRSGAAYTWHDVSTSRYVAFPGFADSLKGSYDAGTAQVFGELGYGINAGAARFEPFANLAYVNVDTDRFTEQGGAAALASRGSTTDATFTMLGFNASTKFTLGGIEATARGTLGWRHAFGDATPLSVMRFAGGSDAFSIAGVPIARDAAVIEAGLDLALSRAATLGVTSGGQFGSGLSDQSVKANFDVKF